jgi:hypothetical protein
MLCNLSTSQLGTKFTPLLSLIIFTFGLHSMAKDTSKESGVIEAGLVSMASGEMIPASREYGQVQRK